MGSIQEGQVSNNNQQSQEVNHIQTGRLIGGINSYDEQIRNGYIKKVNDQQAALDKYNSDIASKNLEIEQQNAQTKAEYDKTLSDIKNMNAADYKTYYNTIPDDIKNLFETPDQLDKDIQTQKQDRATKTLSDINTLITKYQADYDYWNNLYNTRSGGDGADHADQERTQALYHIEELNNAKNYATGDYSEDDIINTAQQIASDRVTHNENSIDYSRMQKLQEDKLVEQYKLQGLEPVYKNPLSINAKELIGFVSPEFKASNDYSTWYQSFYKPIVSNQETTSVKNIQQIKTPLNLQKVQASQPTDQLGQPISKEQIFYLNPTKEVNPTVPFEKSILAESFSQSKGNLDNFKSNGIMKPLNYLSNQTKLTNIPKGKKNIMDIGLDILNVNNNLAINGLDKLGEMTTKGYENIITENLKQPLTQDQYYNLPYNDKGTIDINAKPNKVETTSLLGFGAKALGSAPQVALWTFAPEVISVPYIIKGSEVALNPNLSTTERVLGGVEAGSSLAFGYGGEILDLVAGSKLGGKIIDSIPSNKILLVSKDINVPTREALVNVDLVNPYKEVGKVKPQVEQITDNFGRTVTKYNYDIKTIIPEGSGGTGKVTSVYRQSAMDKIFKKEPTLIYSGNPYTDKAGYNAAKDLLNNNGVKNSEELLRFTAPKVSKSSINGEAYTLFSEDLANPIIEVKAKNKVIPDIKTINNVKTRSFESKNYLINSKGISTDSEDISVSISNPEYEKTYLTKDGNMFSKLKETGKSKEVFTQFTGTKELGTGDINFVNNIQVEKNIPIKSFNSNIMSEEGKDIIGFTPRQDVVNPRTGELYKKGTVYLKEGNTFKAEQDIIIPHEKGHIYSEDVGLSPNKYQERERLADLNQGKVIKSDIKTSKPEEFNLYQQASKSIKEIPKETSVNLGRSKVLTRNIDNPLTVSYDLGEINGIKVTKTLDTGSVTGTNIAKGEKTQQQILVSKFDTSTKELDLVKDAKQNLVKEEQRVSTELLSKSIPQMQEVKAIEIKPVEIKYVQEAKSTVKSSSLGVLGTNPFQDLTGSGKIGNLSSSRFGDLGVMDNGFKSSSDTNTKTTTIIKPTTKTKVITLLKPNSSSSNNNKTSISTKEDTSTKIKSPQKSIVNEVLVLKTNQDTVQKTTDIQIPNTPNHPNNKIDTGIGIDTPIKPKKKLFNNDFSDNTNVDTVLLNKAFNVLIRSKGKIVTVGNNLPYNKAIKLGSDISKSGLSQTFALKESGNTIDKDISYKLNSNVFSTPKLKKTSITPITFTEKRGKTLTTGSEIKGLQRAKKW